MATHFLYDFAETDGTRWTDASFEKVLGTTAVDNLIARINSGAGEGKITASSEEAVYRYTGYLPDLAYKVQVTLTWNNAAGQGRAAGVGVRVLDNGDGYYLIVDSNIGSPRFKLIRRSGGSATDLVAWTALSEGPTDLNAGIDVMLRVENDDNGDPTLAVYVAGTQRGTTYVDTDGSAIGEGSQVGCYHGDTLYLNDVTFDDLEALDFQDEAAPGVALGAGLTLAVNGTYYNAALLAGMNVSVRKARQSYVPNGSVIDITDENDAHEPALRPGDWVTAYWDGVALACGYVRARRQSFPPPEGVDYEVIGPRELANDVYILDPNNNAGFVSFNYETDSEFYDATRSDKTVGEILAWIWDNHSEGEDGLRAHGAAPTAGVLYESSDLTALDAVLPHLTISGSVTQAEETLLGFMPEFAIWIDPATRKRRVHRRSTAAARDIKTSEGHVLPQIICDPKKNKTCVIVHGSLLDAEEQTFLFDPTDEAGATLLPAWDRTLEGNWTIDKSFTTEGTFPILGFGTQSGGPNDGWLYLDPDTSGGFSMDEHEWATTLLVFLDGNQTGNSYTVRDNSTTRIWLKATAWQAGGNPAVSDHATVTGSEDPAYERNGNDAAFREFNLKNAAAKSGFCGTALIKNTVDSKTITVRSKVRHMYDNPDGTSRVKLDLPAIALINFFPDPCLNVDSIGWDPSASVEMTVPVAPNTDKHVPYLRVPASGFRGTAYSFDPANWDGGGQPDDGDAKIRSPLVLDIPEYQSEALQATEYQAMADSMLAVYGTLAFEGTFQIADVLTVWAGMNSKITFQDDLRGRTTGYESSTDLWLLQVEWDLANEDTILTVGTMSAGSVDLGGFRKRFAEKTRLDALRRQRRLAEEIRNCLKQGISGAGQDSGHNPYPTGGCKVLVNDGSTTYNRDLNTVIREVKEKLIFPDWLEDLLRRQKGITNVKPVRNNSGDIIGWQLDFGGTTYYLDSGGIWHTGSLSGPAADPFATGFNGIEGGIQHLLMSKVLELEGYTFDSLDSNGRIVLKDSTGTKFTANDNGVGWRKDSDGTPYTPKVTGEIGSHNSNKRLVDGGVVNSDGSVTFPNGSYKPDGAGGWTPVPGSGPGGSDPGPGPVIGGALGALAGKCGSSFDGKNAAGSGPGCLLAPGSTVGADQGVYYPPTEAATTPDYVILDNGDIVPASSTNTLHTVLGLLGLTVTTLSDPGGPVFTDGSAYYRVEVSTRQMRKVDSVTPGTGVNGGDYAWHTPATYYTSPAGGGTNALLDGSVHTDTENAAPSEGDLIVANATPRWDVLGVGSRGQALVAGASAPAYMTPMSGVMKNMLVVAYYQFFMNPLSTATPLIATVISSPIISSITSYGGGGTPASLDRSRAIASFYQTTTSPAGIVTSGNCAGQGYVYIRVRLAIVDNTNGCTWIGFLSAAPGSSGNPTGSHASFRLLDGTDTNWKFCLKDGTTQNPIDTGVPADTDFHTFEVRCYDGSTGWKAYIDGVEVASSSTNAPGLTTGMSPYAAAYQITSHTRELMIRDMLLALGDPTLSTGETPIESAQSASYLNA